VNRLQRQLLGGFASIEELDAAIEAELERVGPEEGERLLREFMVSEGFPVCTALDYPVWRMSSPAPPRTRAALAW
jgi:hypothetical protein